MSVQDVEKAIISVLPIIERYYDQDANPSEEETRRQIIDPILTALGWSAGGQSVDCLREYYVTHDRGHRVDYAMFTETGNPTIIVEAKRFSEHTLEPEHFEQAMVYAGIAYAKDITAVLTNGEYWNIFEITELEQRADGLMVTGKSQNPIGLLWEGATIAEQAQRLHDELSYEKHWKLTNRGGGMRRWRGPASP